jgi:transposase InsO family protein
MEFENFGDFWVGDYHHGPLIRAPDDQVVIAKIGAFIDHATRYPVADRYYLGEDLDTLRDCLLRALLRWGAPKLVYVDRAKIYKSDQLEYSLHRVKTQLVHSRAYYSKGRGVIERWWQLLKDFESEVALLPRSRDHPPAQLALGGLPRASLLPARAQRDREDPGHRDRRGDSAGLGP